MVGIVGGKRRLIRKSNVVQFQSKNGPVRFVKTGKWTMAKQRKREARKELIALRKTKAKESQRRVRKAFKKINLQSAQSAPNNSYDSDRTLSAAPSPNSSLTSVESNQSFDMDLTRNVPPPGPDISWLGKPAVRIRSAEEIARRNKKRRAQQKANRLKG